MPTNTKEEAPEWLIEKSLTGTCLEDIKSGIKEAFQAEYTVNNHVADKLINSAYYLGDPKEFDTK